MDTLKHLLRIKDPLYQLLIENLVETMLEYEEMLGEKADRQEIILQENTAVGSLLELRKKVVSKGLAVYEAFKAMKEDIVAIYPPSADPVIVRSRPPSLRKVLIIVAFAIILRNEEDMNEISANQELFTDRELFENIKSYVSYIEEKFQREFPPSESAAQTIRRLIPLASENTQEVIKQLLSWTVEEANTQIKAKPHVHAIMNIANNLLTQNAGLVVSQRSNGAAKPENKTLPGEIMQLESVADNPALQHALELYIFKPEKTLAVIAKETKYRNQNSLATLISSVRKELIQKNGEQRTNELLPHRKLNSSWRKAR